MGPNSVSTIAVRSLPRLAVEGSAHCVPVKMAGRHAATNALSRRCSGRWRLPMPMVEEPKLHSMLKPLETFVELEKMLPGPAVAVVWTCLAPLFHPKRM